MANSLMALKLMRRRPKMTAYLRAANELIKLMAGIF